MRIWRIVPAALIAYFSGLAGAQSLSIAPSTVANSGVGSLLLKLDFENGKSPLGLQWKFVFPAGVTVVAADIVAGSAAQSAQKSLVCRFDNDPTAPRKTPRDLMFFCIVAGGNQPIGRGTVATVRYRVLPGVTSVSAKVRVEKVVAVSGDLQKMDLPGAEGAIVVQ